MHEIIRKVESTYSTVEEDVSSEIIATLFQASDDDLIDTMRSTFSILAARVIGHDEVIKDTQEVHDQWHAALRELSKAHLRSVNEGYDVE